MGKSTGLLRRGATLALLGLGVFSFVAACVPETPVDGAKTLGIPDQISARACQRAGGSETGIVGQACVFPTKDAGKVCTSGNQCSHGCIGDDSGTATTGICAAFTSTFGCYSTVENGKATPILCVD